MYAVEVRDHVMIAHSLAGEVFGPAQRLHGATYVTDVCFMRPELDASDIVVDIGLASETLKQVLGAINFSNLDEHPDFRGRRSTTELVARWVFDRLREAIAAGRLGPSARGLSRLKVTLHESHAALASYEADLTVNSAVAVGERAVWIAVPGDPATLTGGYIYARRLADALRASGWRVERLPLPAAFPFPAADDLAETARRLAGLPSGARVIVDGLAFGAIPPALLSGLDIDIIALVHHPLARETGLTPDQASRFVASERAALAVARAVIATSAHTAAVLHDAYDVPRNSIHIAAPGTDPQPRSSRNDAVPQLLTVATVTPRKACDVLVAALAAVADLAWHSVIVGSLARAPDTAAALRRQIADCGLAQRVILAGTVSDEALGAFYAASSIFVLPSRYEGYGMAFAEALAHGLPIVATRAGAVADTVPQDAAVLVPVDDAAALADALRSLLTQPALRARLAGAAWIAGQRLPRWDDAAKAVARVLEARR